MSLNQAFNPILPSWEYIPDGEPHLFGDRLYLFGSHDRFNGTQFCMNDYVSWSCPADNLADWRCDGTIYRKQQDPAAKDDSIMQAPDVCRGADGRYYLYYTLGLVPFMSVAVSDTPAGQYSYYGTVRYEDGVSVGLREHDVFQFDPGIFIDDNGRIWLYSGFGPEENGIFAAACKKYQMDGAYVMELQDDMLTVKAAPKLVFPKSGKHGFFEGSSMRKIGSRYYFVYASQLGHELCYATSNRPDGGFSFGGTLVSNGDVGPSDKPQNYTGNTHGSLVNIQGQWYIFYHRQTNRHQYSRQACAEKIELDQDSHFHQAELTSCGLNGAPLKGTGIYEARIACNLWSKDGALEYGLTSTPEAEAHPCFTQTGVDREGDGDQYIANIRDGATAGFKFFDLHNLIKIGVEISGTGVGGFSISSNPKEEAFCHVVFSAQKEKQWFYGECQPVSGIQALYFTFHGKGTVDFHTFTLKEKE